jgi:hypothetical protein
MPLKIHIYIRARYMQYIPRNIKYIFFNIQKNCRFSKKNVRLVQLKVVYEQFQTISENIQYNICLCSLQIIDHYALYNR